MNAWSNIEISSNDYEIVEIDVVAGGIQEYDAELAVAGIVAYNSVIAGFIKGNAEQIFADVIVLYA